MGYTTSFFSGLTLTSTVLYLSLIYHQNARIRQAAALHQQSLLLNSITDPVLASNLAIVADANYSGGLREGAKDYRLEKAPFTERLKDDWNREVTGMVRRVQGIRWANVGAGLERRVEEVREGERKM